MLKRSGLKQQTLFVHDSAIWSGLSGDDLSLLNMVLEGGSSYGAEGSKMAPLTCLAFIWDDWNNWDGWASL